ncbi:MAG: (4Fe-4S)-binding protein [Flavipsychrobacter sp.]|jgi:uncharacterized Fe-S cluster protein YjdI
MEEITKHYTNGEITIAWKPNVCIHSKLCWTGLLEVFDPRKRPWIDMTKAETDLIISQVEKCPSGALSYFRNDEKQNTVSSPEIDVETIVEVTPNGPLMIYGNITIKHKNGEETKKNKVTALCRCGQSSNKPYCDGTHRKVDFKDE